MCIVAAKAPSEPEKEHQTPECDGASCSKDYKELGQRKRRCKELERIVQTMTTKKQLMVRGRVRTLFSRSECYSNSGQGKASQGEK